nr:hypothetical protein [Tanacetum cinerariifolium]
MNKDCMAGLAKASIAKSKAVNATVGVIVMTLPPTRLKALFHEAGVKRQMGVVSVTSPTGVLDLVDYLSSSEFDPSEDSLPVAPELPLVSPLLCTDDSGADNESEPAE